MKKGKRMSNKGFSLVEIIIVIAIMVILAGMLAPMFVIYVERSRESMDIDNMQIVYDVANAAYSAEENEAGVMYYYGREELMEAVPTVGYGKGGVVNGGRTFPNPCCEDGEYDPSKSYEGKYIQVIFPDAESSDSIVHVHWVD